MLAPAECVADGVLRDLHQQVAQSEPELAAACKKHTFDVVVIGQSLSAKMKAHVVELVRRHCIKARIVELYPSSTGKKVGECLCMDRSRWRCSAAIGATDK